LTRDSVARFLLEGLSLNREATLTGTESEMSIDLDDREQGVHVGDATSAGLAIANEHGHPANASLSIAPRL
jgi:hypothetical protein